MLPTGKLEETLDPLQNQIHSKLFPCIWLIYRIRNFVERA